MRLIVEREELLKPLQLVMGVVERKQILPILSNVLFEVKGNSISLTGTDLEVELVGQLQFNNPSNSHGKLTLPGRKLMDIFKALPETSSVEIHEDNGRAVILSGRSRFTLSTLPADDFPNVDQSTPDIQFNIKQSLLHNLIQRCAFSMAQQDVRYYLNGLLLEITSDHLRVVATDGHRLASATLQHTALQTDKKTQVIIPRKGVVELLRLINSQDDSDISIEISQNNIQVKSNSYKITSKLIEGRFPDYDRVIPKKTDKEIILEKSYFKDALNRVAILCNEKFRGLRFEFSENLLRILANNPEQELAEEELKINYPFEPLDIGFNVAYLIEIINSLQGDTVTLKFSSTNNSLVIDEAIDGISSVYVVMPMRI